VRVPGSAAGAPARFMGIRLQPVVLSSPFPPEECLRRLGMVTTQRGMTWWYMDPRTVGSPEPRFRGVIGPSRIFVARFAAAGGRSTFVPWLDARLEPAAGGATTLAGTLGLRPAVRALVLMFVGVAGLIAVAVLAEGVHLLVTGHLSGLVPAVLAPVALAALVAGLRAANLRLPERQAGELLGEMNEILGVAVASAGPAADSSP
jgi:hypothetical protein